MHFSCVPTCATPTISFKTKCVCFSPHFDNYHVFPLCVRAGLSSHIDATLNSMFSDHTAAKHHLTTTQAVFPLQITRRVLPINVRVILACQDSSQGRTTFISLESNAWLESQVFSEQLFKKLSVHPQVRIYSTVSVFYHQRNNNHGGEIQESAVRLELARRVCLERSNSC